MAMRKYTKKPAPTGDVRAIFLQVIEILAGRQTETAAAEKLGLSRVQFQNRMNRGLQGLVEGLTPKPAGRPAERTDRELELEEEIVLLQRQISGLEDQLGRVSRIFEVGARMAQEKSAVSPKKKGGPNDAG